MAKKNNDDNVVNTDLMDDLLNSKQVKMLDNAPSASSGKPKLDLNDALDISNDEIERIREETLNKLEEHVKMMRAKVKPEELAKYMLENRIELLEKGKYLLNEYMVSILTTEISNPRAFEVLSILLKTTSEINDSVVNIKDDTAKTTDDRTNEIIANTSNIISDIIKNNLDVIKENNKFKNKDKDGIKVMSAAK